MTVTGKITAEERQWVYDFIYRHLEEYCTTRGSRHPAKMLNWRDLFLKECTTDPAAGPGEPSWDRRKAALEQELSAACARLSRTFLLEKHTIPFLH